MLWKPDSAEVRKNKKQNKTKQNKKKKTKTTHSDTNLFKNKLFFQYFFFLLQLIAPNAADHSDTNDIATISVHK